MSTTSHFKVIIIGSGPAGLTAAIYSARANLRPLVLEGTQPGGQLTITTEVENYPGFPEGIQGPELMELMRKQAQRFGAQTEFKVVSNVDFTKHPFKVSTDDEVFTGDTIIIATGASARLLGIPSESEYMGFGVSACATCDGFFYKNQSVAVVGGGDTAMEEASYLTKHASKVTLIHRRDQFRASKILQKRILSNPKINVIYDSIIEEVVGELEGNRKKMTGLKLKNVKTGMTSTFECNGLFVAIGHKPNTELFVNKIEMNEVGYIRTQSNSTKTNIPGVFAAGDVADPTYRQAISAAGTGCMASIDAERYLVEIGID